MSDAQAFQPADPGFADLRLDVDSLRPSSPESLGSPRPMRDELFGSLVFDETAMQRLVEPSVYKRFRACVKTGTAQLEYEVAEALAAAMLKWARAHGATHYTHWFQPLGGRVAEKHDTFLDIKGHSSIIRFDAKQLVLNETDGSSFPSGGARGTSNARGYTCWDPSSFPFIIKHTNGSTMYIPCCFFAWKDCIAIDDKTPMLRSDLVVKRELLRCLAAAGDEGNNEAYSVSGLEQEFFMVDEELFLKRPDLVTTGRTLLGRLGAKGQQLEDQYWGAMTTKALDCVHEMESECWKLGIPIQTRHREVAPGQYEMAPRFADMSVAVDRNLLMLETMRRVAKKHGLVTLLHEKPFKGVNGSGKHNNWSVSTDKGQIFVPGKDAHLNMRFMLGLAAVLRAVHLHGDVLRCAILGASNDHRLGANEAPPAIMSVYLGASLSKAMKRFIAGDKNPGAPAGEEIDISINLRVPFLPAMNRDEGDRNRTSPFAFTGNRFEFRAVGSSQNPARSSLAINTIVADSFAFLADEITKAGGGPANAERIVRETLAAHQAVHFEGDGYSQEWRDEARARGLPELRTTGQALGAMCAPKNIELFSRLGVLSEDELRVRWSVFSEDYHKRVEIEARTLVEMVEGNLVPVVAKVAADLKCNALSDVQVAHAGRLSLLLDKLILGSQKVTNLADSIHQQASAAAVNDLLEAEVLPTMDAVREAADELESLVPASAWPFPSYAQLLHRSPHI